MINNREEVENNKMKHIVIKTETHKKLKKRALEKGVYLNVLSDDILTKALAVCKRFVNKGVDRGKCEDYNREYECLGPFGMSGEVKCPRYVEDPIYKEK